MDAKTKIKLLADLQSATENPAFKDTITALPSGVFLWTIVSERINKEIDYLLNGETISEEAFNEVERRLLAVTDPLRAVGASELMTILFGIKQRLDNPAPAVPQQAPQSTQAQPSNGTPPPAVQTNLRVTEPLHPSAVAVPPPATRRGGSGALGFF